MIGIYKIENILNSKVYIGSSKDIKRRWREHLCYLKLNKHHSSHLQYSFNKYGAEVFKFSILLKCTLKRVPHFENMYVEIYKATERKYGYNMTTPHPINGAPLNDSLETKEKIRRAVYIRHYGNPTEQEYQDWKTKLQKEKDRVKGILPGNAKTVLKIDKTTGEVLDRFITVVSAALDVNSNPEVLRRVVTGKTRTHKGFIYIHESKYDPTYDYRILKKAYVPKVRVIWRGSPIETYDPTTLQTIEVFQNTTELANRLGTKIKYIQKVLRGEIKKHKGCYIRWETVEDEIINI